MEAQLLLGKEEFKVIQETRNLLDDLLETLDILADAEAMKKMAEAKADVKKGRLYGLRDL